MEEEKINKIKKEYEDKLKEELGLEINELFFQIDMEEKIDNLGKSIENENDNFEKLMVENSINNLSSCSIALPSIQVNGFIQGPYANLLIRAINSYTPDLFRLCWLIPNTGVPYICPTLVLNKIRSFTFIQSIIDIDIIKAFLYFGFSSDINTNYKITVKYPMNNEHYRNLAIYLKSVNQNLYQENIDNFTDFTGYFYAKYPPYTLFAQLVRFTVELSKAHSYSTAGNTLCPYVIPWQATFLCAGTQIFDIKQVNYQFNITLLNNIYALYYNWLGTTKTANINALENDNLFEKYVSQYYVVFFKVLAATSEVFEDVIIEFSYKTTQKYYVKRPYMTQPYYDKCVELYKIYEANKINLSS